MGIISLKNINKIYGQDDYKVVALDNINLEVEKGELIAIMGPSGSGKSTLLNILGFMDIATTGEYYFEGKNIASCPKDVLAKIRNEKIGFVFQNFNLIYDMNIIDNVALPITYSKDKRNAKQRSLKVLELLGLGKHTHKTPDKLSGGQKQRVAIARALVNNPEIILADEPTGALDKATGIEILDELKRINKEGKTVIIITHDIEIANMCNKIIRIVDGRIK